MVRAMPFEAKQVQDFGNGVAVLAQLLEGNSGHPFRGPRLDFFEEHSLFLVAGGHGTILLRACFGLVALDVADYGRAEPQNKHPKAARRFPGAGWLPKGAGCAGWSAAFMLPSVILSGMGRKNPMPF